MTCIPNFFAGCRKHLAQFICLQVEPQISIEILGAENEFEGVGLWSFKVLLEKLNFLCDSDAVQLLIIDCCCLQPTMET